MKILFAIQVISAALLVLASLAIVRHIRRGIASHKLDGGLIDHSATPRKAVQSDYSTVRPAARASSGR